MNAGAAPGAEVVRGVGAAAFAILIAAYPFLLAAGLDHASARTSGASLRKEPSIVGQFARAMHDGFSDFLLPYCRKVTWMWCAFFAVNAAVGMVLAVSAPTRVWKRSCPAERTALGRRTLQWQLARSRSGASARR